MKLDLEKFQKEGYAGPFKLFNKAQCEALLQEVYTPANLFTWYKSPHEESAPIVRTASSPTILNQLKPVLGEDILLWGSHFIAQPPEQAHAWHLDVEYGKWNGVTVWLGLRNLNSKTTVSVITHSHLLDVVPQQLLKKFDVDTCDDQAVLKEAKKLDPRCELKTFTLNAGEFIIWSGRAWHSTLNKSAKKRFSIILQYCSPENIPKIPLNYEYPDTKWDDKSPPCVLVSGVNNFQHNVVLKREDIEPSSELLRKLKSKVYKARHLARAMRSKLYAKIRPIMRKQPDRKQAKH